MLRGPAEVAKLLKVEPHLIKTWAYLFREHLSELANPAKGVPRQFTNTDILVLDYIGYYWEDDPDIENIEAGLNAQYYESDTTHDFVLSITPLFQEIPEDIDEDWQHGTLLGGMSDLARDNFALAESYRATADLVVNSIPEKFEAHEMIYPILYNYRHAIELYLKAVVGGQDHDLKGLLQRFCDQVKRLHAAEVPSTTVS